MDFPTFLQSARSLTPRAAMVLGSGLGSIVQRLSVVAEVSFAEVPGFAAPTVHGHGGRLLVGHWATVPVLLFQGRMHYYEGHPWERVTATIRLAVELGVRTLILTNAAGGIHDGLNPGDLMVIRDHLAWLDRDAWKPATEGPSRKSTPLFDADYCESLVSISARLGHPLLAGTYAALTGPCYETPAEIRALKCLGADAVGMSTVREAAAAVELGLRVAAISCITNKAAGLSHETLDHAEVQQVAGRADVVDRLANIVETFLREQADA